MKPKNSSQPAAEDSSVKARLEIYDWVQCIVFALVVCIVVFVFFFRTIDVVGHSMEPTLMERDKLIVTKLFYKPSYGDIVVLRKESFSDQPIVKRVIATEGQKVDIDFEKGIVYVDGEALDEPYIAEKTTRPIDFEGEVEVPEGCVFVMGDNRNKSTDSRDDDIGMVDTRYIIGREILRVFPLNKFGFVD
ncbi:MAG: signal peptidase I [Candidatus Heteroscillospira sp.]|jgi:signal peptidase I